MGEHFLFCNNMIDRAFKIAICLFNLRNLTNYLAKIKRIAPFDSWYTPFQSILALILVDVRTHEEKIQFISG